MNKDIRISQLEEAIRHAMARFRGIGGSDAMTGYNLLALVLGDAPENPFDAAIRAHERERCKAAIIMACGPCEGRGGYDDGQDGVQCEYCGRPCDAIDAIMEGEE